MSETRLFRTMIRQLQDTFNETLDALARLSQVRRRVDGQPGGQQEDGQKAADARAPKSAHLLLQVRAKVLNDDLAQVVQRWCPVFATPPIESAATEELAA